MSSPQPTWSCGIFNAILPTSAVYSPVVCFHVGRNEECALISAGCMNAMTYLDQSIKALLHWHPFMTRLTHSLMAFRGKKATKHQLRCMILWFWIMKESHQCCSAADLTSFKCLQTYVDDEVLHNLQEEEKQSSWNLCFPSIFWHFSLLWRLKDLDAIVRLTKTDNLYAAIFPFILHELPPDHTSTELESDVLFYI